MTDLPTREELCVFLDAIAFEALESGDQEILDIIEEFCDEHGLNDD